MALRSGQATSAVTHFTVARDIEDGILYNEPPFWYYPIRASLGQALLADGRPAEAQQAYEQDLALFPENVWALAGLKQSLVAQGKTAEAALVQLRLDKAAASADVTTHRLAVLRLVLRPPLQFLERGTGVRSFPTRRI